MSVGWGVGRCEAGAGPGLEAVAKSIGAGALPGARVLQPLSVIVRLAAGNGGVGNRGLTREPSRQGHTARVRVCVARVPARRLSPLV